MYRALNVLNAFLCGALMVPTGVYYWRAEAPTSLLWLAALFVFMDRTFKSIREATEAK